MPTIGNFEIKKQYTNLDPDVYFGTITECEVEMEKGLPKLDDYGKNRIRLVVQIESQYDDEGNEVTLRRSLPISYGKNNQTQKWADLANLIQICTGTPQGNPAQKSVTTEEVIGKKLRVKTINVEKNGNTYTNIDDFMPLPKATARPQPAAEPDIIRGGRVVPASAEAPPDHDDYFPTDVDRP